MTAHSYWRINITANNGSAYNAITELQFRTTVGGTSVAVGGTALESSHYNGNVASLAFDGNTATFWNDNGFGMPQYLGYHFTSPVSICEIAITAWTNYDFAQKNFTVDYSDDGSTWIVATTILNETGWGSNETRTYAFFAINGNIIESLPITNWRLTVIQCVDGLQIGTSLSGENSTTYNVHCASNLPCNIICSPKIDYAWAVAKTAIIGDYVVAANPEMLPHIWKCTAINEEPYYSTDTLLLTCTGPSGSSVFLDSSPTPKVVVPTGTVQISTAQNIGGSALLNDTKYLTITGPLCNSIDWTIELYVYITSTASGQALFSIGTGDGADSLIILLNSSNQLWVYAAASTRITGAPATVMSLSTWNHIAFVKLGTSHVLYLNGVPIASFTLTATYSAVYAHVMRGYGGVTSGSTGYVGSIRVSSMARYTTNFTPPTAMVLNGVCTGVTEPTWNLYGTTADNTVTWTYIGPIPNPVTIGPKIPS